MNFDADARHGFAGEVRLLDFFELNSAIDGSVNGVVSAHESSWAGDLSSASLTDEDFASLNFLAAKTLNAEALAGVVV